ncbi:uncharacterized protein [Gossypium hirsutum]|uniref:RNase H type-1 domain-containing protein n=1 Tax=Gossypium hirsutum TaxID=3635 RepID=A0A1U8JW56_GOSHI|nr:uncharacterized protein LOC107911102 [Gossypium hirsutum]
MTMRSWKLPEVQWAKVNVYGLVASHIPRAVIGRVVETIAVLEGLKLAWDWGFSQIELEHDNSMLIELIQNGWVTVSNVDAIRGIHGWCLKSWEVKFRHIQREANRVVDCIVKVDGGVIDQLILVFEPLRYVWEFLEDDL